MNRLTWLLASLSIAVIGQVSLSFPANSQTGGTVSDTSGHNTFSAGSVSVGIPTGGFNANYNSNTGLISIQGANGENLGEIALSPKVLESLGQTGGTTIRPNQLAQLLTDELNLSLNDLAQAEKNAEAIEQERAKRPRRIARRATECVDPTLQAREQIQARLKEIHKFINTVNHISNQNNGTW